MDNADAHALGQLALGRILRLLSRPAQPGDVADYETARRALLDADEARHGLRVDVTPNYARDRNRGAAGD